jgi:hypothetical protein
MDETKWYDAKTAIAAFALPLIKELREKHIVYPNKLHKLHNNDTDRAMRAWDQILGDIIWSLEMAVRDESMSQEEFEAQQRGFELMGRWFGNLWD